MTSKYAQLPLDMQEAFATTAGVILSSFDPEKPGTAEEIQANVLYATTGGVNVSCVATYTDDGEDIDNCPKNMMENMRLTAWECKLSGTALTLEEDTARSQLGAADKTNGKTDATVVVITPRMTLKAEDFETLWYVCPYGTQGGFIAVKLENAMNRGGFSMKTQDNGKGQFAFDYTGHSSMKAPTVVPFTFYMKKNEASTAQNVAVEA